MRSEAIVACLVGALALLIAPEAQADERSGIFGGFELSLSRANISPETQDDLPEIGSLIGVHVGYRFGSGLALSGGFSGAAFDFDTEVMGVDIENNLSTDLVEVSAWFFLPLGDALELHLRAGAGRAFADFTTSLADPSQLSAGAGALGQSGLGSTGATSEQEKGFGVVLSAGADWRVRGEGLRAFAELHLRWMGVSFAEVDGLDEDILTTGVSIGVGWGP